jgi:tRNA G18 (ribose-2'-O)-methylase SpoU
MIEDVTAQLAMADASSDMHVDSCRTVECCTAAAVAPPTPSPPPLIVPNVYLVITNISKRNNIRALLQTAAAFECTQVFVVGQKNFNFEAPTIAPLHATNATASTVENHEEDDTVAGQAIKSSSSYDLPKSLHVSVADGRWPIRRFDNWNDCVAYLTEHDIWLVGVEIDEDAQSISQILQAAAATATASAVQNNSQTSCGGLAWCLGNEGTGLHAKQRQSCRAYCRIPQYGGGTASLNVYVAASIVLYQCHLFRRQAMLHHGTLSQRSDASLIVGEQRSLG